MDSQSSQLELPFPSVESRVKIESAGKPYFINSEAMCLERIKIALYPARASSALTDVDTPGACWLDSNRHSDDLHRRGNCAATLGVDVLDLRLQVRVV